MADNDFGPKWTVNSGEVLAGGAYLLAFIAAIFILAPAFIIGVFIGERIWDVKIFKYPLGVAFTVGYFFLLKEAFFASPISAVILVFGVWLFLDYGSAKGNVRKMWIVQKIVGAFKWLFSA